MRPNHEVDDPLPYYYRPLTGSLYRRRIQLGLDLLTRRDYGNVLEFGYGSGILLPTLAGIARNLHGVDITSDPATVNQSLQRLRLRAHLKNEDLRAADYHGDFFDLIVAFSVFEHIAEPDGILAEMRRILKPGGALLVGMPRVSRMMEKLFALIGYDNIGEHHVATHREFGRAAQKYFTLEKSSRMFRFLPEAVGLYFVMLFTKTN